MAIRLCLLAPALIAAGCATAGSREAAVRNAVSLSSLASELDLAVQPTRFPEDRIATTRDGRTFYIMAGRPHYRYEGDAHPVGASPAVLSGGDILLPGELAERIREQARRPGRGTAPAPGPAPPRPRPLSEAVVMVDAGHGGRDPGAIHGSAREKDIALAVSKLLARRLRSAGARVVETRTGDAFVSLDDRVDLANKSGVDLFVSIHANAAANRSARGVEVFYPNENSPRARTSKRLAELLNDRIAAQSDAAGRGAKIDPRGLRVLRATRVPAVLVELGFMTNDADLRLLTNSPWHDKAAGALYEGIAEFWREHASP